MGTGVLSTRSVAITGRTIQCVLFLLHSPIAQMRLTPTLGIHTIPTTREKGGTTIVRYCNAVQRRHTRTKTDAYYCFCSYFPPVNIALKICPATWGFSLRRRTEYPYQSLPYGTYTRTACPSRTNSRRFSSRTPISIWNS